MEKPEGLPKELKRVSEEHFDVLFFSWKIAEGLRNNVETARMKRYADWFFENHLKPHLKIEKDYVFPVLGLNNVRVKRALANHRRMKRLFNNTKDIYRSLNRIEEEVGAFVRFEERVIFKQVKDRATNRELNEIKKQHRQIKLQKNHWEDKFWELS